MTYLKNTQNLKHHRKLFTPQQIWLQSWLNSEMRREHFCLLNVRGFYREKILEMWPGRSLGSAKKESEIEPINGNVESKSQNVRKILQKQKDQLVLNKIKQDPINFTQFLNRLIFFIFIF
jgi:hypothetical protein